MSTYNISSLNAYQLLQTDKRAVVIDVRTTEEWSRGVPKVDIDQIFFLSWRLSPDMSLNKAFQANFMLKAYGKQDNILFLCRSGVRSFEAAQFVSANMGFMNCYNIIDGFEGGANGIGWKQNDLPWQVA